MEQINEKDNLIAQMAHKIQKSTKYECYFNKQKDKKYRNCGSQCSTTTRNCAIQVDLTNNDRMDQQA